ncbi:MAG: hypothetical protein EHM42_02250, partial [Planctomycetaceae bacterium]
MARRNDSRLAFCPLPPENDDCSAQPDLRVTNLPERAEVAMNCFVSRLPQTAAGHPRATRCIQLFTWAWLCSLGLFVLAAVSTATADSELQPEDAAAAESEPARQDQDSPEEGPAQQADDKPAGGDQAKEKEPAAKKPDEKADAAKPAKKARNPLTDLIIKSLQPARGSAPAIPVPGTPGKAPTAKHPTDATAPYDRRGADWMIKARNLAKGGDWKQALKELQKIAELPEDSLFQQEGAGWISLRVSADRLRGEAPAEVLDEYRVQFGGLAQQLLNEALQGGRVSGLGRVARGYFHTNAGYDAANRLGTWHFDRGEYSSAARWFLALWEARAPLTQGREWRKKAALALKSADLLESARSLLTDPTAAGGAPPGPVEESLAWLDATSPPPSLAAGALSDWPMFYGDPTRTGRGRGGEPLLLPRWRLRLTDSEPVREQIASLLEDLADQQSGPLPVIQPILVDGLAAFRTLHGVQVIDVAAGQPLWSSVESQSIDRLLAPQTGLGIEQQRFFNGMVFMGGAWGFNGNFAYSAGQGEGSPLCHLLFRNANFGLLSSDGIRLFVVE